MLRQESVVNVLEEVFGGVRCGAYGASSTTSCRGGLVSVTAVSRPQGSGPAWVLRSGAQPRTAAEPLSSGTHRLEAAPDIVYQLSERTRRELRKVALRVRGRQLALADGFAGLVLCEPAAEAAGP